ncbi:glycosyltransferase [Bacteroidales bacterium OttesenSCG-928-J19]|nr:glycosyltransferase [Bacteroidales bacterium OttesenSCG-928-J19]
MKILQINKYYYIKGGAETVFFNTIKLLEEQGHTVIPFSLKSDKNFDSPYSSYFVDYPELSESGVLTKIKNISSFLYNKEAARQLERLIIDEKPDIAHIHLMFNSFSVSILPVLKKYNIPVVLTVHDYRLVCPAYTFINGKGIICEECLEKKSYMPCIKNKCYRGNFPNSMLLALDAYMRKNGIVPTEYIDEFVFVSSFAQKKHIQVSSDYKRSTILYNFTNIQPSSSPKKDYILYFGRISEEKGLSTLIKTMQELPHLSLKIAGTGPLLSELKETAPDNVEFLGFKSGNDLTDYIKKALAVILPSEWYENGPMVIPESYMLGTPVIGSRIGGIPEFIDEGETGYLFDPGNAEQLKVAIEKAINLSPEAYARMCENALAYAEKTFTKEVYYEKLISLYNRIISNKQ